MAPAPISWPPSQYWDDNDGLWSTFALRVGNPEQVVRVLPSTTGQATWVVTPQGCLAGKADTIVDPICIASRGGLFNSSQSTSWHVLGNYSLGLESNLGYNESGTYGRDKISLGLSNATGGPTLGSQLVVGIATEDYHVGVFGLGVQGTNISSYNATNSTYLMTLKGNGLIPSLSWGYTAGAKYRNRGYFGSLTLGGYDSARFTPNNISHSFAPDISRDLVVNLDSIITNTTFGNSSPSLLTTPIATFIDSTQPYIYLPLEACQAFEAAFGLEWNETARVYWVNDTLHQTLSKANPTITFGLRNPKGGPTADIVLPYASFDLQARGLSVHNMRKFFPLQRAVSDSQYTLGRTFLQEAYLITDYEHSNFSVSQCLFDDAYPKNIVAITSATANAPHISRKTIIGTSLGAASFLTLVIFAILFIRRSWTQKAGKLHRDGHSRSLMSSLIPRISRICSLREIDSDSIYRPIRELPDTTRAELLDERSPSGSSNTIPELFQSLARMAHELRSYTTSRHHSVSHTHSVNASRILISTRISRKSRTSFRSSSSAPCVETTISSSAHRENPNRGQTSVIAPTTAAEIYELYMRRSLNLDRSLPPTPISESPQMSPVFIRFSQGNSFCPRPHILQVPERAYDYAVIHPDIPMSRYSFPSVRHKRRPVGVLLPGLGISISPGISDLTTPTPTTMVGRQGHGRPNEHWA